MKWLFFTLTAYADNAIISTGNNHYVSYEIDVIEKTLIGILLAVIGWLIAFIISRFIKGKDSNDRKLDELIKIVTKLDTKVDYLERISVKKEDITDLIRNEIKYREIQ